MSNLVSNEGATGVFQINSRANEFEFFVKHINMTDAPDSMKMTTDNCSGGQVHFQLIQGIRKIAIGTVLDDNPFEYEQEPADLMMTCFDYENPAKHPIKNLKNRIISYLPEFYVPANLQITPDNFYLQPTLKAQVHLNQLQTEMNTFYDEYEADNPSPAVRFNNIVIGGHYVAYVEERDKKWYRVVTRSIEKEMQKVLVQLLDYGDIIFVNLGQLRQIRAPFCKLAIQAYHAKTQFYPSKVPWTNDEIENFKSDVGGKDWKVIIVNDEQTPQLQPMQTLYVLLVMQNGAKNPEPYTFGGRIKFEYRLK